jgi:hypothetical protein
VEAIELDTNLPMPTSHFEISTVFFPPDETPPEEIMPGDEGIIDYRELKDDKAQLKWKPVLNSNGDIFPAEQTRYLVYVTTNDKFPLTSACQMEELLQYKFVEAQVEYSDENGNIGWVDVEFNTSKRIKFVFANVVAEVSQGIHVRRIPYQGVRLRKISGGGSSDNTSLYWGLAAIVFGIVFIAAVITAFAWYKYKKTQARLRYEMNDVRNVAGIESHAELTNRVSSSEPEKEKVSFS